MTITPSDPVVPVIQTIKTVEVFSNRFGTLFNDHTIGPTGVPGRYLKWQWAASGMVVVPVHANRVGLWWMYRYSIGAPSLEFPRGSIDTGEAPEDAALRELHEETGVVGHAPRVVGSIYPDSGLIGSPIDVVAVEVESPEPTTHAVEVMESVSEGGIWLTGPEIRALMRDGRLRCAVTIAAWASVVGAG